MNAATDRLHTYQDLLDLLNRDAVLHQAEPGEQSARIPTRRGGFEGVLTIRWQERDRVIQFIHPLPIEVPSARLAAVESAVARINHALALPGFGINHEARGLYYRVAVPLPREGADGLDVVAVFQATVKNAADFYPALRRVVLGESRPETVVADVQVDLALSMDGVVVD